MNKVKQAVTAIFKKREQAHAALSALKENGYHNLALHAKAVFSDHLLQRKSHIDNPVFSGAQSQLSPAQRLQDATSFSGIYQSQGELMSGPKTAPERKPDFADFLEGKGLPHEKVSDYRQALDDNRFVVLVQQNPDQHSGQQTPEHSAQTEPAEQLLQHFQASQIDSF